MLLSLRTNNAMVKIYQFAQITRHIGLVRFSKRYHRNIIETFCGNEGMNTPQSFFSYASFR
jgi:hypothetical protein